MKFSVPILHYGDPKYPNVACFVDYVKSLVTALRELGHIVVPPTLDGSRVDSTARPIVFGGQNMKTVDDARDSGSFAPETAILYNTEQTGARGADPKRIFDAVDTWRDRVVWDYSTVNMAVLREMGCKNVVHCPVGYHSSMTRIEPLPPEKEDIDVLFYGSVETPPRLIGLRKAGIGVLDRRKILFDLEKAGLKVEHVFGKFHTDLDLFIRRSKIVLNLHYYEGAVFEIFRCSHLLANSKCIVTEDGGVDAELEHFAQRSMVYVPRKDIVGVCRELVKDHVARYGHALRGANLFKQTSMVENVRQALAAS